jgi:predicted hydrocarbon binding protein
MPITLRESLSPGHVKGSMIRAHVQWAREQFGDERLSQLLASLPEAIASEVNAALASTWCSFESVVRLDREIARTARRDENTVMRELGRHSAELNLSTVYRAFRRDDIHEFFRRSTTLHRQFQDFCDSEYVQTAPTRGEVRLRAATCFSPIYCASAAGYYEQVIRLHGGGDPIVTETTCRCAGDDVCTYVMAWR